MLSCLCAMPMSLAVSGEKGKYPDFKGNVLTVETRDFWREADVSPKNQGYHYNRNAETYMLIGDALVDNNNPFGTDPSDGGMWDQEGPHIMMLFPTLEEIANLPRDPNAGGPYVMWDGTPLVHVMIPMTDRER